MCVSVHCVQSHGRLAGYTPYSCTGCGERHKRRHTTHAAFAASGRADERASGREKGGGKSE